MTQTAVQIRRSGNIIEVNPGMTHILGNVLSYTHRDMNMGFGMGGRAQVTMRERPLYSQVDGRLITTQGVLKRITDTLDQHHVTWTFEDLRPRTELKPDLQHLKTCLPNLSFRLKQDEILAHLIGENSGQIIAPTAYGKTFLMMALVALYPDANIIITSPSAALLSSGYRRIREVCTDVGRVGGGHCEPKRVTLSTIQSLMRAPIKECDILLVDESHRVCAPLASKNVAKVRNAVKYFGMTATPEGGSDGAELVAEALLGPPIYSIEYAEAAEAGLVSKLKVALLEMGRDECPTVVSTRFSQRVARKRHGYWRNHIRNTKLAWATNHVPALMGLHGDLQKLVLVETLEHALHLKKLLPDFQLVYGTLSKEQRLRFTEAGLLPKDHVSLTPKIKERLLQDFETGVCRKVIATGCWGEGVDFVHLDVLVNASGAASSIATVQWSGRNSRKYEGKQFGLIIDSHDNWDTWAHRRAGERVKVYRQKGWEVLKVAELLKEDAVCPE